MSVSDWGTGRPDYSAVSFPARTEVESTAQTAWNYTVNAYPLGPLASLSVTLYDVPANSKLVLGFAKATINLDGIGEAALLKNGSVLCPIFAAQYTVVPLPDTTGFVFDAGDTVGFEARNTIQDACILIRGDFSGFVYKV